MTAAWALIWVMMASGEPVVVPQVVEFYETEQECRTEGKKFYETVRKDVATILQQTPADHFELSCREVLTNDA